MSVGAVEKNPKESKSSSAADFLKKIIKQLNEMKLARTSHELDQLSEHSKKILEDFEDLQADYLTAYKRFEGSPSDSAWRKEIACLNQVIRLVTRLLAETRKLSQIKLSTLSEDEDADYISVSSRLQQSIININKIFYETVHGFVGNEPPIFLELRNLLLCQCVELQESQKDLEEILKYMKPPAEVAIAKRLARDIPPSSQTPTDKLARTLQDAQDLAERVALMGDNFHLYAEDTLITRSHEWEVIENGFNQLYELHNVCFSVSDVQEKSDNPEGLSLNRTVLGTALNLTSIVLTSLTQVGLQYLPSSISNTLSNFSSAGDIKEKIDDPEINLKRKILASLATTGLHLDLLKEISKLINEFRFIQSIAKLDRRHSYDAKKIGKRTYTTIFGINLQYEAQLQVHDYLKAIAVETGKIREKLKGVPEDQSSATSKLLDNFQRAQHVFKEEWEALKNKVKQEEQQIQQESSVAALERSVENDAVGVTFKKVLKRVREKSSDGPATMQELFRRFSLAVDMSKLHISEKEDPDGFALVEDTDKKNTKKHSWQRRIFYSVCKILYEEVSSAQPFYLNVRPAEYDDFRTRIVELLALLQELAPKEAMQGQLYSFKQFFSRKIEHTEDFYKNIEDWKKSLEEYLKTLLPVKARRNLMSGCSEEVIARTSLRPLLAKEQLDLWSPTGKDEKARDISTDFENFTSPPIAPKEFKSFGSLQEIQETIYLEPLEPPPHVGLPTPEVLSVTDSVLVPSEPAAVRYAGTTPQSAPPVEIPRMEIIFGENNGLAGQPNILGDMQTSIIPSTSNQELDSTANLDPVSHSPIEVKRSTFFREIGASQLEGRGDGKASIIHSTSSPALASTLDLDPSDNELPELKRSHSSPQLFTLPSRQPSPHATDLPESNDELAWKKPLVIGLGVFLTVLIVGVTTPTITGHMIGKDKTLEFLFSSQEGSYISASYMSVEVLLGLTLMILGGYWLCNTSKMNVSADLMNQNSLEVQAVGRSSRG